jgi:hypothetical protein
VEAVELDEELGGVVARVKPFLLGEEDAPPAGEGMRWRLDTETDEPDLAAGIMELLHRRCFPDPRDIV